MMINDLPVTSIIGCCLSSEFDKMQIFHSQCPECNRYFNSIQDLREHLQIHGIQITDEQYKEKSDIESFIRNKTGIIINQCEYNHDGMPLFEYACTHPDLNKGFKTFNEYVEHRNTVHCDQLSVLNFYLADLIRWIRKTKSVLAIKDFFKELFIGQRRKCKVIIRG